MNIAHVFQMGLIASSLGLGLFCTILSRRLRRLNDLETGLGGAIAIMAAEIERLEHAILNARAEAISASADLAGQITQARKERALWDLRQRLGEAAGPPATPAAPGLRKRRKCHEVPHA